MFAFVGDVGPVVNGAVFSDSGVNSLQHRCIVSLSHIFCYCLLKHLYNCSIFVIDLIYENALKDYEEKLEDIPEEVRDEFEKAISLRVIDNYWMEHISTMSHLRDGIGLRGYANTSPLQAYTMEGYQLFY